MDLDKYQFEKAVKNGMSDALKEHEKDKNRARLPSEIEYQFITFSIYATIISIIIIGFWQSSYLFIVIAAPIVWGLMLYAQYTYGFISTILNTYVWTKFVYYIQDKPEFFYKNMVIVAIFAIISLALHLWMTKKIKS